MKLKQLHRLLINASRREKFIALLQRLWEEPAIRKLALVAR